MPDLLYLDIETTANPAMTRFIGIPEPPTIDDVPASYVSSAAKTEKWFMEEEVRREKRFASSMSTMPLDVDYCRLRALAMATDDEEEVSVSLVDSYASECEALELFWSKIKNHQRPCGYNILRFDLPILLRRSWVLQIAPTRLLDLRRYTTTYSVDLMEVFYSWGGAPGKTKGLKAVAEMYGIPNDLPGVDGSMVDEMTDEELAAYCANDVRMVKELAVRTKGWYW